VSQGTVGGTPTVGWRIANSLWMLWGFLSLGLLWFVGFWIVAVRRRSSALWYITAVLVTALDVALWVLVGMSSSRPDDDSIRSSGSTVLGMLIFVVPVVALVTNIGWLRWLWRHQQASRRQFWGGYGGPSPWRTVPDGAGSPWPGGTGNAGASFGGQYAGAPQGQYGGQTPAPGQAWGTAGAQGPGPVTWGYYGTAGTAQGRQSPPGGQSGQALPPWLAGTPMQGQPHGGAQQRPAAPTPGTGAVPVIGGPLLDLNLASLGQLAALPGVGEELARAIVVERDARGAYRAVSELVARGVVQPHVFLTFSTRLSAGPMAAPPTPGLGQGPGPAPSGRRAAGRENDGGRRLEF
jgi:hypothetical protein